MFKDLFSNRLFIGAIVFFVLTVGGSLLYMRHVQQQTARELAATQERVKKLTEKQNPKPTTEAPVAEALQGHFHSDGTWHDGPHTPHTLPNASFKSGTPTSTDAPPGASLEQFAETEMSAESSNQRGPEFVFNSPTLYPHELKQWVFDLNDRMNRKYPELARIGLMTREQVLATYSREELEALNKKYERFKGEFIDELRALAQAMPKEIRDQTVSSTYEKLVERWGPEKADEFLENLFQ